MNKITTDEYEAIFNELKKKVEGYRNSINQIEFARCECIKLDKDIDSPKILLDMISNIIDTSKELNQIIEQSPTSIYVADEEGNTIRVNKTFSELTGVDRANLLHKNTSQIEAENVFMPSVISIALKEKRRVMIPQVVRNDYGENDFVVAGTPILDENGKIFRVITNSMLNGEIQSISDYLNKRNNGNTSFPKLIAESDEMKSIVQLADLIKNTSSTVLLGGETGVGKSLLARYIHNTSERKNKRMTEINCGAIPAALLESELFGYASGAFTGASIKGKAGLIEICEGGTILLDEISELPFNLQVKLLQFLQNRTIIRVGGTEEISVDVRVIAATNRNLKDLVNRGEFREDLYYRLNVVPIIIPPLRERKSDIVPALRYFVNKYTKMHNKVLPITDELIEKCKSNYWNGNLRELENTVERWVVTEGSIGLSDTTESKQNPSAQPKIYEESFVGENHTLSDIERDLIINTYEKYRSSYKVAKALGISQSAAYRKIKKYVSDSNVMSK